ncbi:MAG: tol-pal system protein YbgF [Candidatus Aminicenantes bacterium]|nr:tol-pal system protein YbgF [Candidatus Aminicenantes bacterium]
MTKRLAGILALVLCSLLSFGQDRSKKAYELIYEDVQVLKKQLFGLEEKLARSAEDVVALRAQIRDLQSLVKLLQAEQNDVKDNLKNIPSQYQFLLDKMDQINVLLAKISENLMTMKGTPPAGLGPGQEAQESPPSTPEKKPPEKEQPAPPSAQNPPPVPTPTGLSPQEVYNTAYADYLKGNFDLATDGFKIYRESFPDSPLADNALYWIGECSFSQRKYIEAIDDFNELILNYPQGDKIAAAYLKKGLALAELERKDEALVVFKLLISKYPLEEEARIAQEKIKDLSPK